MMHRQRLPRLNRFHVTTNSIRPGLHIFEHDFGRCRESFSFGNTGGYNSYLLGLFGCRAVRLRVYERVSSFGILRPSREVSLVLRLSSSPLLSTESDPIRHTSLEGLRIDHSANPHFQKGSKDSFGRNLSCFRNAPRGGARAIVSHKRDDFDSKASINHPLNKPSLANLEVSENK
jgi:hypothetical protein